MWRFLAVLCLLWPLSAQADGPISLGVAVGPAMGPPSVGVLGRGSVRVNWRKIAVELAGGEGWMSQNSRTMGSVTASFLYRPARPLVLEAGLLHLHETPWHSFRQNPAGAIFGVAPGIRHRSGFLAGVGWEGSMPSIPTWGHRVHPGLRLQCGYLPDSSGPKLYGLLLYTLSVDFGKTPG
jgi:hypothetical protein